MSHHYLWSRSTPETLRSDFTLPDFILPDFILRDAEHHEL
jgi:hypothetical protein